LDLFFYKIQTKQKFCKMQAAKIYYSFVQFISFWVGLMLYQHRVGHMATLQLCWWRKKIVPFCALFQAKQGI
jgi:hypothetical protein